MRKILVLGAHPDDCEIAAGGTAALWRRRGDIVRFVSVTNGNAGHFAMEPAALARRRRAEALSAAEALGVDYEILDIDDGRLEPTLDRRLDMIRRIRRFLPDLIVTHRPNDYHPDHRYTSLLVQDSAYMVTVPLICPDVPHMARNPVIAYFQDRFQRPCAFKPDVAVDVGDVMPAKWKSLHAHTSQFYEWLPFNDGSASHVPPESAGGEARLAWLERKWGPYLRESTSACRQALEARYGKGRAAGIQYAEAFEVSEYGSVPGPEEREALFPR